MRLPEERPTGVGALRVLGFVRDLVGFIKHTRLIRGARMPRYLRVYSDNVPSSGMFSLCRQSSREQKGGPDGDPVTQPDAGELDERDF